jgi:hypothetical protein
MLAIGVVASTINNPNFDFAVPINGIAFLVKNADDIEIEDGDPVVVQYEPADQFCKVIPLDYIERYLPLGMGGE